MISGKGMIPITQQKISADFMIELLHEDDLDDGDELPGLNNDEIADRDELSEVNYLLTSVSLFYFLILYSSLHFDFIAFLADFVQKTNN